MSEYTEQAEKFLAETGTEFTISYLYTSPYFSGENEHRDVWRFTLKNSKGEYSSMFGSSMNSTRARALYKRYGRSPAFLSGDKKEHAKSLKQKSYLPPTSYDILACLEKYEPDTFDNWCNDLGYNEKPLSKYPDILKIWTACVEQYRGIKRLFTEEQMEKLRDIS